MGSGANTRVKYGGVWYDSLSAAAKAIGCGVSTISQRVTRYGQDLDAAGYKYNPALGRPNPERAVRSTRKRGCGPVKVKYDGVEYPSIRALSVVVGRSSSFCQDVVLVHGEDLDAAGYRFAPVKGAPARTYKKREVDPNAPPVIYGGRKYKHEDALASVLGLFPRDVRKAVETYGHDLDAAGFKFDLPERLDLKDLKWSAVEEELWK